MQLDHMTVEILKKVAAEPGMTIKMLCEKIGLPQRNFYHRRTRINDWLIAEGFTPLICDAHRGVHLAKDEATGVLLKMADIHGQHYKLNAEERRDNLLLHLACHNQPASRHLSELNRVSRNTTLNDICLLKTHLQQHRLTLVINKKQGYRIDGSNLARRLAVQQMLQHTLKFSDYQAETRIAQILLCQLNDMGIQEHRVKHVIDKQLQLTEQQLNRVFTDKDRRSLQYMILFSLVDTLRGRVPEFTSIQSRFLREQSECEVAAGLNAVLAQQLPLPELSGNTLFFSLLLSASKKVKSHQENISKDNRLMVVVKKLIEQFQALSGVYLQDVHQLESRLISHLGPAIHRCLFGIHSENVLKEEILQRYPMIFRLCRQIIISLEREYHVAFCDDELSYVVISFAAWLDRRPETGEQHLLLVTEGGLSSTAILENQLRNLTVLPLNIEQVSASQLQLQGIGPHIRLVVSTIGLSCQLLAHTRFIQTQHLLTEGEKQQIRLMLKHNIEPTGIAELVNALVTSATRLVPQQKEPLNREFSTIISQFIQKQQRRSRPLSSPGLPRLLLAGFTGRKAGWQLLIRKAAQPLIKQGIIDSSYARNIVRRIESRGLTTYLTPDILLLHDTPPPGATEGALSLLKLRYPLHFDIPGVTITPSVIVILVPASNLAHIPLLESLNALISDETSLADLLSADSQQALQCCINGSLII
ncbi:PRD domain-containing protein [Buttiauxella sp. B2]|uniref:PRD domain-containing protein n=1 Tax=Buttiauxella sp. B2 TaxID=2587812 RepID=UPI0011229B49|nr:PRD domain-containing protein [Buttiauxella sp. B2]TNV12488.1 PRD domain-containing protein [Buttiauxella sp. B2]